MKRRYTSYEDDGKKEERKGQICEKKLQCQNEEENEERKREGKTKRKKEENGRIKRQARMEEDFQNGEKRMREYVS